MDLSGNKLLKYGAAAFLLWLAYKTIRTISGINMTPRYPAAIEGGGPTYAPAPPAE